MKEITKFTLETLALLIGVLVAMFLIIFSVSIFLAIVH